MKFLFVLRFGNFNAYLCTMTPFLKQVADHFYSKGDVENTCFVFPSRRSMLFFRKYLGESVAADASRKAIFAPEMVTVNEFFYRSGGLAETDRIRLIIELYESYRKLLPECEKLDEFIFWGDVLLGDFDDVDKYLVNASQLFTNVAEFKAMGDDFSYLSETQRAAMDQFTGLFEKGESSKYKVRFLRIWNVLYPLYVDFRSRLREKGMAYGGMVYRDLAESEEPVSDVLSRVFPGVKRFVFVGLNVLSESERRVLSRMRDAGIASFCWDYKGAEVRDPANRSSKFMDDNVARFPQAFETDPEGLPKTSFRVISVPSSTGQAKLLPQLLKGSEKNPLETAVILPDEGLLEPVLSSIPTSFQKINVTMGRPGSGSAFFSLMRDVAAMQLHLRSSGSEWYFYHRQVRSIFSSGIFRKVLSPEEEGAVASIVKERKFYIPEKDFGRGEVMRTVFRPVAVDLKSNSREQVASIVAYMREVVIAIASRMTSGDGMLLELDFARRYLEAVDRLSVIDLEILPATWFRLIERALAVSSVPFHGEPLVGLQIMGPLETRALDFDKVIILSANEGVFPRRSVSSSYIPAELRSGFGLPTFEHQDSVSAYYFYRLIQRASSVTMVTDNRTEGLKTGEQSRYIKQLEYHYEVPIEKMAAVADISPTEVPDSIRKTPEDIESLKSWRLSASALKNYLECPARFYYSSVKRLKDDEEIDESLDGRLLGNVLHEVLHRIYDVPDKVVTLDYLKRWQNDEKGLLGMIDEQIKKELKSIEVSGRDLVTREVILKFARNILIADCKYMAAKGASGIRILGLEEEVTGKIGDFDFVGYIDRLDSVEDGVVRVVDYKTGTVSDLEVSVDENSLDGTVKKLLSSGKEKRPEIVLQVYLYDRLLEGSLKGEKIINSVYSTVRLSNEDVRDWPAFERFTSKMEALVEDKLKEIADLSVPFKRVENKCKWCDFKTLCGK